MEKITRRDATFHNLEITPTPRLIKVKGEARTVNRSHSKNLLESTNLKS